MWMQAIREAISLGQEFLCHGDPGCEAVSGGALLCCATLSIRSLSAFSTSAYPLIRLPSILPATYVHRDIVMACTCLSVYRAPAAGIPGRYGGEDEPRNRSAGPTLSASLLPLLLYRCDPPPGLLISFLGVSMMPASTHIHARSRFSWVRANRP